MTHFSKRGAREKPKGILWMLCALLLTSIFAPACERACGLTASGAPPSSHRNCCCPALKNHNASCPQNHQAPVRDSGNKGCCPDITTKQSVVPQFFFQPTTSAFPTFDAPAILSPLAVLDSPVALFRRARNGTRRTLVSVFRSSSSSRAPPLHC